MRKEFLLIFPIFILFHACRTGNQLNGFSYQPRTVAPSFGSTAPAMTQPGRERPDQEPLYAMALTEPARLSTPDAAVPNPVPLTEENTESARIVREISTEMEEVLVHQQPATHRELVQQITARLESRGVIHSLSSRQETKLAKWSRKLDHKAKKQGKEIDFRNNTPLELFFMIMAIAGLVMGILGLSWGWLMFVVFGGLWLYYKLVVDNR
jgi:hypothetical protein